MSIIFCVCACVRACVRACVCVQYRMGLEPNYNIIILKAIEMFQEVILRLEIGKDIISGSNPVMKVQIY